MNIADRGDPEAVESHRPGREVEGIFPNQQGIGLHHESLAREKERGQQRGGDHHRTAAEQEAESHRSSGV